MNSYFHATLQLRKSPVDCAKRAVQTLNICNEKILVLGFLWKTSEVGQVFGHFGSGYLALGPTTRGK